MGKSKSTDKYTGKHMERHIDQLRIKENKENDIWLLYSSFTVSCQYMSTKSFPGVTYHTYH